MSCHTLVGYNYHTLAPQYLNSRLSIDYLMIKLMKNKLTESQDNVASCKHCGRVYASRIAKLRHENNCPKKAK